MKVVSPAAASYSGGRTFTLTDRLKALTPSTDDLADAAFVLALSVLALYGFASTFDTYQFLAAGALGVFLGILTAHLAVVLRWHWLIVILLVIVEFFLLGGALAVQGEMVAGVVPTAGALAQLASVAIGGWKDLVTTLPPVAGDGPYVALPYLLGLVAGALGQWLARRPRRVFSAVLPSLALMGLVILLGTLRPAGVLIQGLGFAAVGFGWLALRFRRRRRIATNGRSNVATGATAAVLLLVSLGGSALLGGFMPGQGATRFVLRTYVQPPIELSDLPSPLVGFRKYSSESLRKFYDQSLLQVDGVPAGSLLRVAVLDDYSGRTWSASGGGGAAESGFQRLGKEIPYTGSGQPVTATVTALDALDAAPELGPWIPSLGEGTAIAFKGVNAKTHAGTFRYNLSTSQGVLADRDRLRAGDSVEITAVPVVQGLGEEAAPGGESTLAPAQYGFLAAIGQRWAEGVTEPLAQVKVFAAKLRGGYWSDGTRPGESGIVPGHGQGRLIAFLAGKSPVGSDEQYASTFALLCNYAGFPARVVFGAVVPSGGTVEGKHLTAWVELLTEGGWRAVPAAEFTPARDKHPVTELEKSADDTDPTYVPPPNPAQLPGSFDQLSDADLVGSKADPGIVGLLLRWGWVVLVYAGPPVGVLALFLGTIGAAKALRRRRRRTGGDAARRFAAGWDEVLDQARDMGIIVPVDATRLQQARLIGAEIVGPLAVSANTATFAETVPGPSAATAFWVTVRQTRRAMVAPLTGRQRVIARFSPRSLLPARFAAVRLPVVRVTRPRWLRLPGRPRGGSQPGEA